MFCILCKYTVVVLKVNQQVEVWNKACVSAHGYVLDQIRCVYCSTIIVVSYLFISMVTGD